tara:strand:+ start:844 stop:1719 length:876 start_codon:yes stop_codon:yes gene_type:complete
VNTKELTRILPIDILVWGAEHLRDLPWRRTRNPWFVLVAEVMLQQTQIDRVLSKWPAFLEEFPTVISCAVAPTSEVVKQWEGMGFNRRAVLLHQAAKSIKDNHGGEVPLELDELLLLPGIGPYTARAILAFAYEQDSAVVDTNVGRVLARWMGRRLKPAEAQELADRSVPLGEGWAWNQAVLDFGSMVCRSKNPKCEECPIYSSCAWQGIGVDPAKGSAGVSGTQSKFEGSDRQGRGKLVAALRKNPIKKSELAEIMGWPLDPQRAERVASTVISDGLATSKGDTLSLPQI